MRFLSATSGMTVRKFLRFRFADCLLSIQIEHSHSNAVGNLSIHSHELMFDGDIIRKRFLLK
jgi:hypothetical protein